MRCARGQAAIEALFVVPACLVCALALVDAGALVRDQLALTTASTAAARVAIQGGDAAAEARSAAPARLRRSLVVRHHGDELTLAARPPVSILGRVASVRLETSVSLERDAS